MVCGIELEQDESNDLMLDCECDPLRFCCGICEPEKVMISIDSGSDEHCAPSSVREIGRRLRQMAPALAAVEGTDYGLKESSAWRATS